MSDYRGVGSDRGQITGGPLQLCQNTEKHHFMKNSAGYRCLNRLLNK